MKTLLLLVFSLLMGTVNVFGQRSDEFEILMQKIRQDFVKHPSIEEALAKYDDKNGSFTDVDYNSIQRTYWPPLVHVERISDFVYAYTDPKSKYYRSSALYDKIEQGLEFWHERNPWCHNWWYNQIAEPQALGVLLIQMRAGEKQLPAELENKLLDRIKADGGDPAKWTGANRTDIALHWIYRACLSRNAEDLSYALENVYNPVVYTTGEGFQHDNSNFQHGTQLYIGGYGDEILKGVTQVAMYTKGTRYAMPEEKIALISKFMRETYYPTIRGHYMLFDVMGRSVSRPGVPDKSGMALFAKRMVELDPAHADEFRNIIARLEGRQPADYAIRPFHTHYFRGDYTLHVRSAYTFDVRMVSTRTSRLEYGNGENLKTYFLSDGCTNIVRRGDEYKDIFPAWNWSRIPGTTAPQLDTIPLAKSDWQTPGTSMFAGGVSDSLYGVTAYAYQDDYRNIRTGAHKAWFFFDNEVVCLGAGIHSGADAEVLTTVNQSLASVSGIVASVDGKQVSVSGQPAVYQSPEWVLHDSIGYYFPAGGKVLVGCARQSGSWYDINNSISRKEPIEKDVFTLGLAHGMRPVAGTYAYVVVPGKATAADMQKYAENVPVEIVANVPDVQAVRHRALNQLQVVFYAPGKVTCGDFTVKVDRPCALLLKGLGTERPTLHVADPGQTMQPVQVDILKKGNAYWSVRHQPSEDPIYAGATRGYCFSR